MKKIGFMQGRLSPKPSDRIQAFPRATWRKEFEHARELGFECIELIFDDLYLEDNPLSTLAGRTELVELSKRHGIQLHSICADYFMNHPLESNRHKAVELFQISSEIGCPLVEFPFVAKASLYQRGDFNSVIEVLGSLLPEAKKHGLKIALETDLPPFDFQKLLSAFPEDAVGANMDLGNSAMWGWDAMAECRAYGSRIFNVHIKDGVVGGSTVPLTTGHTDFKRAFEALAMVKYRGDFILQTAPDPDYLGIANKYKNMTRQWAEIL